MRSLRLLFVGVAVTSCVALAGASAWRASLSVAPNKATAALTPAARAQPIEAEVLQRTISSFEEAAAPYVLPEFYLLRGQLLLAASPSTGAAAKVSFEEALSRRPNAPKGWRGLIAASASASDMEVARRASLAAFVLDGGDPFTVLTALTIILQNPTEFGEGAVERALAAVPKLELYPRGRHALAKVFLSLDESAADLLLSRLNDPDGFKRLAKRVSNK